MKGLYGCVLLFLSVFNLNAQSPFTSVSSGNWNVGATWGRSGDVAGVDYPIAGQAATISASTTVTVPSGDFQVGNLTITSNNTAILNVNGVLTVNGAITGGATRGFLNVNANGRLVLDDGSTVQPAWTRLFVKNLGALEMNYTSGGTVPACTYEPGAILRFTGYTSASASAPNFETGVSLQNVEWNCPNQGNDIFFNGSMPNLLGYLKVISTGNLPWYVILTSTNNYATTVVGDLEVSSGGYLVLTDGVASASLTVNGNISILGAGSQLDLKQSSGIGTLNVKGDLSLNSGTIGTFGAGAGEIVFNGTDLQTFSRIGGSITANVNYTVFDFSLLDLETTALTGAGKFTLNNNATLFVGSLANAGAIQLAPTTEGNIQVTGTRTYASASNIVYNGTAAQKLGNGFPLNVNLEIDNEFGVANNNVGVTNFVGNLTLTSGALTIGSSNTLNIQSNFFTIDGSIAGDITSNLTFSGSGTLGTLRLADGKNVLNNLTVARIADLVLASDLTVFGVIDLSGGNLDFSGQTLTMNGSAIISNATGLKSSSASNLVFGGTTFSGSIPFIGTGNQLQNLTFSTNGGTYSWNNGVVVNNSLFLTAGTLTHNSGLTMANNSTLIKGAGSIANTSPTAQNSYNVIYTGVGNTGLELPALSTALNNLTISSVGTVNLASSGITINGDLAIIGGTLAAGANAINMKGANWTVSGGVFDPQTGTVAFSGSTTIGGTGTKNFNNLSIASASTLTSSSGNINVSGSWVNSGQFFHNDGTVTFNGAAQSINQNGQPFYNVIFAGTGIKELAGILDVDGALQINSTLDVSSANHQIRLAGSWTNNGSFVARAGTVMFDGLTSIFGSTVTNFRSISIAASASLNGPASLNVSGNFTNSGSFNSGTGTVLFNGTGTQLISGNSVTDFNNITVTNTAGPPAVRVQTNQNLRGVLTLAAGSQFDPDGSTGNAVFTLISASDDPTEDASIATLPTGAGMFQDGVVTVQRHMSIEGPFNGRIYRFISSPVRNAPVSQIQTEIPITGTFSNPSTCSGCNSTAQSMFQYNEEVTTDLNGNGTTDLHDGYVGFPSVANTDPMENGRGYTLYVRANIAPISTAGSARWDVRGPINSGPISFNDFTSFTPSGNIENDGWNFVGNPYPSTIDWEADAGWTRQGINDAIYMKDDVTGQMATYVGGIGANGGSRYVPMGQAFMVKSDGDPIDFQINENAKVAGTQSSFFRERPMTDILRIALRKGDLKDEAVIRFTEDATASFDDGLDAYKLANGSVFGDVDNEEADADHRLFNLSSVSGGSRFAINALSGLSCGKSVTLDVSDVLPGTHSLDFSQFETFGSEVQIRLVDHFLGTSVDLRTKSTYDFEITTDPGSFGDRFEVSFSTEAIKTDLGVLYQDVCAGNNATVELANTQTGIHYFASLNGSSVSETITGNGANLALVVEANALAPGQNNLVIMAAAPGCDAVPLEQSVTVKNENIYSVKSVQHGVSCEAGNVVSLSAEGAPTDGQYNWYETETDVNPIPGANGPDFLTPALDKSKTYYVSISNALGCEGGRVPVTAEVTPVNGVVITSDGEKLISSYAEGNQWYLDGERIGDATGNELSPKAPGTYKVEVTVGGCTTSAEFEYLVTSVEDPTGFLTIYPNAVESTFTVSIQSDQRVMVRVYSSLGVEIGSALELKKSMDGRKAGVFDISSTASGFYIVQIEDGNRVYQKKILKK